MCFYSDRFPNKEELNDLPFNCPIVSAPGTYEGVFSVDVILDYRSVGEREEEFIGKFGRWTFRLN